MEIRGNLVLYQRRAAYSALLAPRTHHPIVWQPMPATPRPLCVALVRGTVVLSFPFFSDLAFTRWLSTHSPCPHHCPPRVRRSNPPVSGCANQMGLAVSNPQTWFCLCAYPEIGNPHRLSITRDYIKFTSIVCAGNDCPKLRLVW